MRFEQALKDLQVPHIFSSDPAFKEVLVNEATLEYENALREEFSQSDEFYDDDTIKKYARDLVSEQAVREGAIFTRIKMAIAAYDHELNKDIIPDKAQTDHNKKELTADIMISESLSADDPLITLINTLVPGESLDINSREDDAYMLNALERHANRAEQFKKNAMLIDEAIVILENAGEYSDDHLATVTRLFSVALLHGKGEQAEIMRQANYDEIIRDNNFPPELAAKLIELVERYYPIENDN
jgi:hypothetical protein